MQKLKNLLRWFVALFWSKAKKERKLAEKKLRLKIKEAESHVDRVRREKEKARILRYEKKLDSIKPRPSNNQKKRCAKGIHKYATTDALHYKKGHCIFCKSKYVHPKKVA